MDTIIAFFNNPTTWDIGHINSWVVAAFAYAVVVLLIARFCGTNGKRASEDMGIGTCPLCATQDRYLVATTKGTMCATCSTFGYTPFGGQEDAVGINPNVPPAPDPNSPAHYYQAQVGTKRTYRDIDMDDPEWAARLEDEL
jgi:hypothetical protein